MKNFITKIVLEQIIPEHEEKSFVSLTCDLCGVEIQPRSPSDTSNVTIIGDDSITYHSSGTCTRTEFDVCVKCFKDEVVPWFISRGAQPRVEEIDW